MGGLPFASRPPADAAWSHDDTEGVPVGLPDLLGRRPEPTPTRPPAAPLSQPPGADEVAAADAESSDVFALPEEVVREPWGPPEPSDEPEPPIAASVAPEPRARVAELEDRVAALEAALGVGRTQAIVAALVAFGLGIAVARAF